MKKIVVPVNFTAGSTNAANYAADMARSIGADLHLLHVLGIPASTGEMPMTEYVFEEMQQVGVRGLKELWEELVKRTEGKVNIFTDMEIGSVEARIEAYCIKNQPFLVIMSASGDSLQRLLAGGSTARAIRHLPYPMIVVPDNAAFHPIKKIVLACDLDDITGGVPVSLTFLKELKELFQAGFEVVNIDTGRQIAEERTVFEYDAWKQQFHEAFPEVHFVETNKVEDGVNQYAGDAGADLLLVFPKRHRFLEFHKSQAKRIALHSPVPVMSIHA